MTYNFTYDKATDKWAIPFPKGAANYTEADLAPIEIPRHVKG